MLVLLAPVLFSPSDLFSDTSEANKEVAWVPGSNQRHGRGTRGGIVVPCICLQSCCLTKQA